MLRKFKLDANKTVDPSAREDGFQKPVVHKQISDVFNKHLDSDCCVQNTGVRCD